MDTENTRDSLLNYTDTRPASLCAFLCLAQSVLNAAPKPKTDFQLLPFLGWLTMRKTKGVITYKQHSHWLLHKWLLPCSYLKSPFSWHNQKEQKKVKAVICRPLGLSQRTSTRPTARLASPINTRLQRKLCNYDILLLYFPFCSYWDVQLCCTASHEPRVKVYYASITILGSDLM